VQTMLKKSKKRYSIAAGASGA
jgi:hypothetical protein